MIMTGRRPPAIFTGNLWQGTTIPPLQIKIVAPVPQVKVREYPDRVQTARTPDHQESDPGFDPAVTIFDDRQNCWHAAAPELFAKP